MPYSHPRFRTHDPTFGGTWRSFWVVVRMEGLRDLEVCLEGQNDYYGVRDERSPVAGTGEGVLRSLLNIRVLERFEMRHGFDRNDGIFLPCPTGVTGGCHETENSDLELIGG